MENKKNDSGYRNSGYRNSGDWNSGDWNSGDRNSGNRNSGDRNSGDKNSGDWNSGDKNSGDWNSGDCNSGDKNSGYKNSGNWNSGNWNSGYFNSGDCNSGDRNSGNWNSGDCNSGFFNIDNPKVRIFGNETDITLENIKFPDYFYFNFIQWIEYDNMDDTEKKEHPEAECTGGYLKTFKYKEAWKLSFDKANKEDVAKTLNLPNFDYEIFEKITGITKEMINAKFPVQKDKYCSKCGKEL